MADAGWFGDPAGGQLLRWWDGEQWTGHTCPTPPRPIPEQLPYADSTSRAQTFGRQPEVGRVPATWWQWPTATAAAVAASAGYYYGVVGESHYQDVLKRLISYGRDLVVELQREPSNPHDRNAIAVAAQGHTVGYIARDDAAELAQHLDAMHSQRPGVAITVRAKLIGGRKGAPSIGVLAEAPAHWQTGQYWLPDVYADQVSVTGEQHHQELLHNILGERERRYLVVGLGLEDNRVSVWAADKQVGVLTELMSSRHRPIVKECLDRGLPTTARGDVRIGPKKLEMYVRLPAAKDVTLPIDLR